MKIDLYDSIMFAKYLRDEKGLAYSSITSYTHAVNRFLATNPDLEDSNSYNSFIVQATVKKKCYADFFALKLFIEFRFQDNTSLRNELLDSINGRKPALTEHTKEYEALDDYKIMEVINNIEKDKYKAVAFIQWRTGARAGDVLRTNKEDIKVDYFNGEETLAINLKTKGNKRKKVRLFREYKDKIIEFLASNQEEYPFLLQFRKLRRKLHLVVEREEDIKELNLYKSEKLNYNLYLRLLKEALVKSNVDPNRFCTHSFRKLYARYLWETYKDIAIVQRELGHSDPRTTLLYLKKEGLQSVQVTIDVGTRPFSTGTNKHTNNGIGRV